MCCLHFQIESTEGGEKGRKKERKKENCFASQKIALSRKLHTLSFNSI
jgi:hypothetical protein